MAYELQVKAVERRFDRGKFIVSLLKNVIAIGTIVVPTFLDGVSSIPITSIGYAAYLSRLFFEFLENDQLRQQVTDHRTEVNNLQAWYNNALTSPLAALVPNPGNVYSIAFAPTRSEIPIGVVPPAPRYLLCNPMTASESMFGYVANPGIPYTRHGAFDFSTLAFWVTCTQIVLTSVAFSTAIAVQISDPDNMRNNLSNGLVLTSLICGAIASIIDPIEEHLKKANLIRAKDTLLDVIYAIRGGRQIYNNNAAIINPPAPALAVLANARPAPVVPPLTFSQRIRNRAKEVGEGFLELFGAQTSGHNNSTIQTNAALSIRVSPDRYRFFQPGIHSHQPPGVPVPAHITEIAATTYDPNLVVGFAAAPPLAPAPAVGLSLIP